MKTFFLSIGLFIVHAQVSAASSIGDRYVARELERIHKKVRAEDAQRLRAIKAAAASAAGAKVRNTQIEFPRNDGILFSTVWMEMWNGQICFVDVYRGGTEWKEPVCNQPIQRRR